MRSQFIRYYDANNVYVVGMQRYKRRGGTLGASGREDPKFVYVDGVVYKKWP